MSRLTLSFKGKVLRVIPLSEGEVTIGSDPHSSVHIDSLAVQLCHAVVVGTNHEFILRDLNTADGTFVNNERIGERILQDGDQIQIGKHSLRFTQANVFATDPEFDPEPGQPSPRKLPKDAWLQILSGHNLGKTISLNRQLTNLGTPGVQTAVIARRNEGYFLSHLEGEHLPRVGEMSIGDRSWHLQDADIIQIGNVRMQFYYQ